MVIDVVSICIGVWGWVGMCVGFLDDLTPWLLLLSLFAISSWLKSCVLPSCVCCETMVFVVVCLFCCGGINSNGFDVGFGVLVGC